VTTDRDQLIANEILINSANWLPKSWNQ